MNWKPRVLLYSSNRLIVASGTHPTMSSTASTVPSASRWSSCSLSCRDTSRRGSL